MALQDQKIYKESSNDDEQETDSSVKLTMNIFRLYEM